MNHSIKRFLLIYLLLTITLISTLMMIGNYLLDNHAIRKHFDTHLLQTAAIFDMIISSDPNTALLENIQNNIKFLANEKKHYATEFAIIDSQGHLLLSTPQLPINQLVNKTNGFQTIVIQKALWRVYITQSKTNPKMTIIIAEKNDLRRDLVNQLSWNNLLMLLWSYPLFGLLIWLSIDRGLFSLKRLTNDITRRQAVRLEMVDVRNAPIEVKPLVDALNRLFLRLQETFERNKRFSADAAHELRTPLAALKTQAQVALKAATEEDRKTGLRNVILGADRCTHIVQQLLTLSRLDPEEGVQDIHTFNLSLLAAEIVAELVPSALEKNIEVELITESNDISLSANETFIGILIRNLVDNAIRYTPEKGAVRIYLSQHANQTVIRVVDTGPGIPKELRTRVFERFYRVLGTQASGSGLGLAIVQQIAELHHAHIAMGTPRNGKGLEISVTFPQSFPAP